MNPTPLDALASTVVTWARAHPIVLAVTAAATVLALAAAARTATLAVQRWRHRRLAVHAHLVHLTPAPVVEAGGAVVFWATLAELLTTGRRWRWLHGNAHLGLEYRWNGRHLTITCWVPATVPASLVAAAARAAWPGTMTRITPANPPLPPPPPGRHAVSEGGALVPLLPAGYPMRVDHDTDPLRPLLQAASGLGAGEHACVQVLARPARPQQVARVRTRAIGLRGGQAPTIKGFEGAVTAAVRAVLDALTPGPGNRRSATPGTGSTRGADPVRDRDARTTAEASTTPLWETAIRYGVTHTNPRGLDPDNLRARIITHASGIASAFGVHTARNRYRRLRVHHPATVLAGRRLTRGFLLPADQLAAVATLPRDQAVPGLDRAGAKPVPAPIAVPVGGRATKPLGLAQVGGHAVALPVADARHHLHVLGATGTGKSTLLTHLILDDIANHRGVVIIDPKGDLAIDVLARLPLSVADRLIIIDPDQPNPARLNPLAIAATGTTAGAADADLVVDNIVAIFARIFARHWGPRIDDVLRVACLTLMRHPDATLAKVPPLLNSLAFRAPFVVDLDDPEGLAGFWTWYDNSPPALRAQVTGPVLARLRAFLLRDFVMATIGQPRSSFDMTRVLNGGILIARLPKGQLGEDTARLMGSFVLASVWQAAAARTRLPEDRRRDASVYIDEAHNVLNLAGSVADMLAEARGYRLSLTLAHQDLAQFPRETVLAISANARNKLYFTCSPEDAHQLARHTMPELDEHDLANLDAHTAAARLVINSRATRAFTLTTRAPRPPLDHLQQLRAAVAEHTPPLPRDEAPDQAANGDGPRTGRR